MSSPSQGESLRDVWDTFVAQYQKTFPSDLSQPLDIRSLQASLSEKVRGDDGGKKTVEYFMRSLTCLSKASDVVFKAAAVAFPPADVCGNAIRLVIDAVVKLHGAFADLAVLVERINAFLETLSLHLGSNESTHALPELRSVCQNVLQHFLTVLQVIYKLSNSKRERLRAAFKIFSEDNEIQAARYRIETLVQDFTNMEVAVILQRVSSQAREIGQVRDGVNTLVDSHTLHKIERALSLHGYGKVGEHNRYQHTRLSDRSIPGTGQWLLESAEFQGWVNGTSRPLLPIMGVRGSGKTMLTNRVVRHLSQKQEANVYVAYYYNGLPTTLSTLGWILRCLIWQLVQADVTYAKIVKEKLRYLDISTPLEMWELLLATPPEHRSLRLLLIDGLYSVELRAAEFLGRMLKDVLGGNTCIRLFMTGQPGSTYHTIDMAIEALGWPRLEVMKFSERDNRRNAEDIRLLAKEHLSGSIWTLQDQDMVATSMVKMLNSNNLFDDLISNVRDLNRCLSRDSLTRKLDKFAAKCREAYIDAMAARVRLVDSQLGPEQMRELNAILPWLIESGGSCEVALLDEVLRLNRPEMMVQQSIVVRLEIYKHILGSSDDRRRVRFWSNIDAFGYMYRQQTVRHAKNPESSHGRITQHEVEVMRSFLKTFCKPDLYENFAFDDFFDSKLPRSSREPHASSTDSHVRLETIFCRVEVIKTCLSALAEHKIGNACQLIQTFSRTQLVRLLEQQDLDDVDAATQQELSLMMAQCVCQPCLPGSWHHKDAGDDLRRLCLAMQKWLRHSGAKAIIDQCEWREVIEEFRDSDQPEIMLVRQTAGKDARVVDDHADTNAGDWQKDSDY